MPAPLFSFQGDDMAYVTTTELSDRMTATKYTDLCAGSATIAQAALDRAESMVDGFLTRLYETPIATSAMVQEWVMRLAEYELYKRGMGDNVPSKYRESYQETINELKLANQGILIPPGALAKKADQGGSIEFSSDTALFDESSVQVW